MCSVRRRAVFMKALRCLNVVAALATYFPTASWAVNDPAKTPQMEFEAAKASLRKGNLTSAETHYTNTITLSLRQLAQLSIVEGNLDQAASYLDSAMKLKPGDVDT